MSFVMNNGGGIYSFPYMSSNGRSEDRLRYGVPSTPEGCRMVDLYVYDWDEPSRWENKLLFADEDSKLFDLVTEYLKKMREFWIQKTYLVPCCLEFIFGEEKMTVNVINRKVLRYEIL